MSAGHDELRRLLGGYLLGGLDDADLDRLDAHLRDCDACRAELEQLAGVPELLKSLPDAQRTSGDGGQAPISLATRPSAQNIEDLLRKMRAAQSRENRTAWVRWLAAAAVVLVAAAIGVGVVRGGRGDHSAPEALPSPQLVTAAFEPAEGSGMTGEATLTPKLWGVSVSLNVTKLTGQGPFRCLLHDHGGGEQQAAMWGPTPTGSAKVIGASSIQLHDVSTVTVADQAGHVLATAHVE